MGFLGNFPNVITHKESDRESNARVTVEELHEYANHYRQIEETRLKRMFMWYKDGVPASRTKSTNKYTGNLIFSAVENKVAFITDHRPKFIFLPQNGGSVELAEAYSAVIGDYMWEEGSVESKIRRIAKSGAIFGDGLGKVIWNPLTQEADLKVLSILKFHPDPLCEYIDDAAFLGYVYPMRTQEIYARYGVKVKPSQLIPELEFDQESMVRADHVLTDIAMVREYWINDFGGKWEDMEEYNERNDEFKTRKQFVRDYKNGRVIGMTDDGTVLYDMPNPLPIKRWHPFIHFPYYPIEGRFWNKGEPEVIEPIVRDYTDLIKQVVQNAKLMANGKTIVNTSSGIKVEDVTNNDGDVYGSHIAPSEAMYTDYGKSMPAYIFSMIEYLQTLADDIIGNADVFQGKMPKGAPSGITVDFLQEASSRRTRETAKNLEDTLVMLGQNYRDMLLLYDPEKLFYMTGQEGLQSIQAGQLIGDYTVRVQAGSTMSTSYSAKTERAIRMFQAQIIDQLTALEMIDDPYAKRAAQRLQQLIQKSATGGEFGASDQDTGVGSERYNAARSDIASQS